MIKYLSYAITFAEVPDEVSLCFTISNCGFHCKDCHSPELQGDVGKRLMEDIDALLSQYSGRITCVCFLGQGNDANEMSQLVDICNGYGLKTALYTAYRYNPYSKIRWDYLKVGEYDESKGPLSSPRTNQRMYKCVGNGRIYEDITYRFWKKEGYRIDR